MGTALSLQHHQFLFLPVSASSFSYVISSGITTSDVSNPRTYLQLPHQNVLQQKPMKYLTLKLITTAVATNPYPFRFQFNQPRLFCAINSSNIDNSGIDTMADNSQSVSGQSAISNGEKEEAKKLEKSTPRCIPPPPPPEKPLPDDCCGSGCVRCVWDIYYEELEAYNNLYKSSPLDSPRTSRASSKQS